MKKLLSFKHWQLFFLIFICGAWTSPSPLKEIINCVAVVSFTLWVYAIGVYGQERIAKAGLNTMNLNFFKTNVIIVGTLSVIGLVYSAIQGDVNIMRGSFEPKDIIYLAGGLYLFFAVFQIIIFACKTIAKIEYRREIIFDDYFKNFLFMFFFFIGIWILQPKINKLIAIDEEVAY